ncbi:MAG: helix-turn-helix domain-containing protein [Lentisphaeria bacterium]|nr:helix-turn-helix domain-containing protein [Lentisphaeria bacterium]
MNDMGTDQVMAELSRSPLIQAVEKAARELVGMRVLFLLRRNDDIVKLSPDGSETDLPAFCHILRGSPAGMRGCIACRALVGFGACYHGLTEYCCHGGIQVIAAAALGASREISRSIVVCSSAFAAEDREAGWAALAGHAAHVGVNLRELRKAYEELPVLTPANRALARALVEVGAAAVGEIARGLTASAAPVSSRRVSGHMAGPPGLDQRLTAALFVARDTPEPGKAGSRGAVLVELVRELVNRDPGMPLGVARIAAAARVTPNHFSMLFRKHTGQTFQEFQTERRMAHAKLLLRDLRLNIGDIAHRVGFPDAGYFTRRFRQWTGMTPTQWRDAL